MKTITIILSLLFLIPNPQEKTKEKEVVVIETKFGNIVIELFDDVAPKHAENFKKLAREGFYNGTTFHRVIPDFVIQGGDPLSKDKDRNNDGRGGPGYTLPAEIKMPHKRGFVGAARQPDNVNPEKRSNGSQFYICLKDLPHLDGNYTVFGRVIEGMDVVDKIAQVPRDKRDNPIEKVEMKKVYLKKLQVK
ncbi:peptidyl-prolyl cis-trans isomerase B (cyclophilin B) [Candidatus Kryptonium thompsonii]|jgi:cyclophilin family peptidyl-prolyl cis-trans isomerase|uniref:Peptidyl-prolyl cis-trans isomerase n=1 Tax=Candidatus Kryptonium thompsonii TaxID=1633631 RepID=A0A0P1LI10_9BACT|nr:peptidylprolyl isomerase [Candidatus Kryptonium thompsoni]CUS77364.1 peptidyl-prolyl cis-trans isomerase B (cyclophilin B) [Candidatus Kryptonium thompsoni]CUS77871.1 peptidyl-prolyl cis-trans isomerase B (cyclophilin B) [Candidatus Kryptonium thompsoni]CUS79493.1 peptidyl-prolyl cis-trans isomerase B (cyclophilin B) [Candidatus Kryptonium thompsoni]CUS81114.1 peptidyl-prolyl cis-trans isomerase B (cyclophilin B) [Candidatus Kryptonium thompsoni]CUS88225.1 peptidyl-prolyl cis-trans isomeras